MNHPHEAIRKLREQGYTYSEINDVLGKNIPKSSLAYICKGVELPKEYMQKLKVIGRENLNSARQKSKEYYRNQYKVQYKKAYDEASESIGIVTKKKAQMALAILYLGEGSKRSSFRGLSLGSSDPAIIRLYVKLLEMVFDIPIEKLKARIMYRADQDIDFLITYWSEKIGVEKEHFYQTKPDSRTIGKPTKKDSYRGVCAIYCAGADKQLALQAYADSLLDKVWH